MQDTDLSSKHRCMPLLQRLRPQWICPSYRAARRAFHRPHPHQEVPGRPVQRLPAVDLSKLLSSTSNLPPLSSLMRPFRPTDERCSSYGIRTNSSPASSQLATIRIAQDAVHAQAQLSPSAMKFPSRTQRTERKDIARLRAARRMLASATSSRSVMRWSLSLVEATIAVLATRGCCRFVFGYAITPFDFPYLD